MLYKIMSTIEAHFEDDIITSQTQTRLQNDILHTSKSIPDKLKQKLIDANCVVDKQSICANNVCKGDVYIETNENLSVIQQRQLLDCLYNMNNHEDILLSPMIIRTAPDVMPNPIKASTYDPHVNTGCAFIGLHVSTMFQSTNILETYKNANVISKALNKELVENQTGLKTVFADMSVCNQTIPVKRDCYILLQKTNKYNDISDNDLKQHIKNSFKNPKINGLVNHIDIIDVSNTKGLIGSISLENVQMAHSRFNNSKQHSDLLSISNNPLFVNGLGVDNISMFSKYIPSYNMTDYVSSTNQPLSNGWNIAKSYYAIDAYGDEYTFDKLKEKLSDVISGMNEIYGCSENTPYIKSIKGGKAYNKKGYVLYIEHDKTHDHNYKECVDVLSQVLNEYNDLYTLKLQEHKTKPFIVDIQTATLCENKPSIINYNKKISSTMLHYDMNINADTESYYKQESEVSL